MTPEAEKRAVEGITICRLCGKGIGIRSDVPIIGESNEQKAARWVRGFYGHLRDRHTEVIAWLESCAALLRDVLIVSQYATENQVVAQAFEYGRAVCHASTRKNTMTDDEMRGKLAALMSAKQIDQVMPVAQYLRDFLSEQGNFEHPAVKQAREQALKTIPA